MGENREREMNNKLQTILDAEIYEFYLERRYGVMIELMAVRRRLKQALQRDREIALEFLELILSKHVNELTAAMHRLWVANQEREFPK